jgi:hypothetical protein
MQQFSSNPNDPIYQQNPNWLRPGETIDQYHARVDGSSGNTGYSSGTINSSMLQTPGANQDYHTPSYSSPYNIQGINNQAYDPYALSPTQQTAQSYFDKYNSLNSSLVGQSAYQTQQNEAFKVNDFMKAQNDLTAQLQALQKQSLGLQNAYNYTIPNQMQQQAEGRGITSGGLQPLQAGELRKNQIQQGAIATQALTTASTLEAVKGNLTTAQYYADQAVKQKYDPIQEEIAATKANLQMFLQSPEYTNDEKKRAQAQLDIQNEKQMQIGREKDNYNAVLAMANAAVTNNPNNSAASMAAQQALQLSSSDPQYLKKAFSIIGQYQSDPLKTQKDIDAHLAAQAGLAQTKAQTAKLYAETQKAQQTINDQGDTVSSLSQQLVNGFLAPSELSKRTAGAGANYNAILKAADEYSMSTTGKHFNIAQADRDYKFASRPQTQDTLNYLGSLVGGVGQTGNLDELVSKSNSINRTTFPAINSAQYYALIQAGDPNVVAYLTTVTEVSDQIAKILQGGGTGGGTSDAKLRQAQSLFQTGFSKAQVIATVNAIKPLLMNRAKSMIGSNPYLSDYADQFGFSKKSLKGTQNIVPADSAFTSWLQANGLQQ